jgi:hypothetical protein
MAERATITPSSSRLVAVLRNGVFGQMNYTFSKALANSAGTSQARLEPFLDNARPELEKTRADFDVTHIINSNVLHRASIWKGQEVLRRC